MKKLLFCYHSSEFGGVEKQILDLTKGLKNDFDISIAMPKGVVANEIVLNGAFRRYNIYPKSEYDIKYIIDLVKLLKKNKFDIVHGHELKSGVLCMIAAFIAKVPVRVYHVHTPFLFWKHDKTTFINTVKAKFKNLVNFIANYFVGNFIATDVIALTNSIKKHRNTKEHINLNKIRVLANGIDVKKYEFSKARQIKIRKKLNISSHDFVILNVARFTAEKGHADLIRALIDIDFSNKFKNMKLVLAGGGPENEFNKIKKLVDDSNLNNIIFRYKFSDKEQYDLFSVCDMFVFMSHAEGFGFAPIEALAASRPVLCSDLDVLKDVCSDSAVYFKTADSTDLGQNLVYLINDKKLRENLSEKSVTHAKKYDIKKFIESYKNLYNNIK